MAVTNFDPKLTLDQLFSIFFTSGTPKLTQIKKVTDKILSQGPPPPHLIRIVPLNFRKYREPYTKPK